MTIAERMEYDRQKSESIDKKLAAIKADPNRFPFLNNSEGKK
jgi:hypothetical protein